MSERCFKGVFTVYATSDNDPYVVFGVSETSCCSGFGCCRFLHYPDASWCMGSGEAVLPLGDAD